MRGRRAGGVLIEATIAITLVAVAVAGVSQLLVLASRQQRILDARRLAQREVGNVMERVMARGATQLTAERLSEFTISAETRAQLPSATVNIAILPTDDPRSRRIRVEVTWREFTGQNEQVEMSAWQPVGDVQ